MRHLALTAVGRNVCPSSRTLDTLGDVLGVLSTCAMLPRA